MERIEYMIEIARPERQRDPGDTSWLKLYAKEYRRKIEAERAYAQAAGRTRVRVIVLERIAIMESNLAKLEELI